MKTIMRSIIIITRQALRGQSNLRQGCIIMVFVYYTVCDQKIIWSRGQSSENDNGSHVVKWCCSWLECTDILCWYAFNCLCLQLDGMIPVCVDEGSVCVLWDGFVCVQTESCSRWKRLESPSVQAAQVWGGKWFGVRWGRGCARSKLRQTKWGTEEGWRAFIDPPRTGKQPLHLRQTGGKRVRSEAAPGICRFPAVRCGPGKLSWNSRFFDNKRHVTSFLSSAKTSRYLITLSSPPVTLSVRPPSRCFCSLFLGFQPTGVPDLSPPFPRPPLMFRFKGVFCTFCHSPFEELRTSFLHLKPVPDSKQHLRPPTLNSLCSKKCYFYVWMELIFLPLPIYSLQILNLLHLLLNCYHPKTNCSALKAPPTF